MVAEMAEGKCRAAFSRKGTWSRCQMDSSQMDNSKELEHV